jgi:hypothetical protein
MDLYQADGTLSSAEVHAFDADGSLTGVTCTDGAGNTTLVETFDATLRATTAGRGRYPFTPPAVSPDTIHRWAMRKTTVMGMPESTAAAAKSPHRYFCS